MTILNRKKKNRYLLFFFLMILAVLFLFLSEFFQTSNLATTASINGFYTEPENTLDVVLIGASEVYSDYCALKAWKEYGYTSYSLGSASIPGNLYLSMLREVLSRQAPQVVVFEINGFIISEERFHDPVTQHRWIDDMQWGGHKWDTITESIDAEERIYFYLPFVFYHNNWKDPGWCLASMATRIAVKLGGPTSLKGFSTYANATDEEPKKEKKLYFTGESEEALRDLLEYCREQELPNVLFVRFPHQKKVKNPEIYDQIEELIRSYGYDYRNFDLEKDQIGLDATADYYNAEHLNIHGSYKFTDYLADYLTKQYDLSVEHSEKVERSWRSSYEKALPYLEKCEQQTTDNLGNRYYEPLIYFPWE